MPAPQTTPDYIRIFTGRFAEILTFLRAGQHLPLKNTFYLEIIEISCDSASRTHTPEMIVYQTQTVSVFVVSICLTTTPSAEYAGT
jgi:hypothetical protein